MSVAKADVVAIAPELANVSDGTFTTFLADAASLVSLSDLGARADLFWKNATAHLLTRSGYGGVSQPVVRERIGEVEVGYAPPAQAKPEADEFWATTKYGVTCKHLLRRYGIRAQVVVPGTFSPPGWPSPNWPGGGFC